MMRAKMIAAALVAAGVTAALAPVAPAWAHNRLIDSDPAPDAVLDTAPAEVELVFAERLDPTFSDIAVTDRDEEPVPSHDPEIDGTRATVRFTAPLDSGTYTVAFRVNSDDGHPVQGSYQFTVALDHETPPAAGTATEDVVVEDTEEMEESPDVDTPNLDTDATSGAEVGIGAGTAAVAALVLLAATAATAGAALLWRRRRARE